ncbi:MAG TPA: hypothetical protein VG939_07660 [Caulobacteraceae bacterium]|nr:hypothetical protein [Caulobacteraceae bacterium]
MEKYIKPIAIGAVIAFVIAFGMSFLFQAMHSPSTGISIYMGLFVGAFTAYILANLAGNRKVQTADAGAQDQALAMTPPAGKALIYAYRDGFVGKAAGLNVAVDGKSVAQLTSPRFTCVAVSPGQHELTGAFGGLAGPQNKGAAVAVTAEAGGVYVYKFGVSMGALQNSITATPVTDLALAKAAMGRMKMTVPDAAEV